MGNYCRSGEEIARKVLGVTSGQKKEDKELGGGTRKYRKV